MQTSVWCHFHQNQNIQKIQRDCYILALICYIFASCPKDVQLWTLILLVLLGVLKIQCKRQKWIVRQVGCLSVLILVSNHETEPRSYQLLHNAVTMQQDARK